MSEENKSDFNQEDIDAINKDIEDAKSKLVSKETEDKIAQAKEEAKKEAEKEFAVNQKVKELEEANQKLQEEKEAKEKEAAEKIANLAEKVNTYVESKQVVTNNETPFGSNNTDVEKIPDEDIEKIENESYVAFVRDKVRKP
jgi:Skp family chaperone for outer membrane proteins